MMKRATFVLLGVVSFYFSAAAQRTPQTGPALMLSRAEIFSTTSNSLLLHSQPVLNLLDGQRLPASSQMGWLEMAPLTLSPNASLGTTQVQQVNASARYRTGGKDFGTDAKDSPADMISLRDSLYYGGEVGFLYGHSTGKFGGDLFQTYMVGAVGNDNFQITVGTSYEEWSGRTTRFHPYFSPR